MRLDEEENREAYAPVQRQSDGRCVLPILLLFPERGLYRAAARDGPQVGEVTESRRRERVRRRSQDRHQRRPARLPAHAARAPEDQARLRRGVEERPSGTQTHRADPGQADNPQGRCPCALHRGNLPHRLTRLGSHGGSSGRLRRVLLAPALSQHPTRPAV